MKENEKGTFGLSSQEVHNIKEDWYGLKLDVDTISEKQKVTVAQVMYAVNLNETNLVTDFDIH